MGFAFTQRRHVARQVRDIAIALAGRGFRILPKTHDFFAEQEAKLRRGDPEIARLYLPNGQLPRVGSLLPNPDLAWTLQLVARREKVKLDDSSVTAEVGWALLGCLVVIAVFAPLAVRGFTRKM